MSRKGLYLTIGVNSLDSAAYGGPGTLGGCENDARDMARIAEDQGFSGATLLTANATSASVLTEMRRVAGNLDSGDIFLLTFSGHGGQVPDINGDGETDELDETWCLYDRQLIDDELYAMWNEFKSGVRILVISDSCNSGTVAKSLFRQVKHRPFDLGSPEDMHLAFTLNSDFIAGLRGGPGKLIKGLPLRRSMANYARFKDDYDKLQQAAGPSAKSASSLAASVILISGCQDGESSWDNGTGGDFTQALKKAWAGGQFKGTHHDFWTAIAAGDLEPSQNPNYYPVGAENPDFERERPFTI
ncbi:caspase family protein [Acidovorax sp. Leaf73]|uniref:caspase family protein n=1 Tax=Acidovorax sp. Leaf73 TaxID=2876566 RepID=UPI001E55E768|nr:caspase family protein [Acidovorax sp. Leaf73]